MGMFQEICGNLQHWVRYRKQHNLDRGVFGLKEALGAYGMAGGKKGKPDSAFLCGVGAIFSDPKGLVEVSLSLGLKKGSRVSYA